MISAIKELPRTLKNIIFDITLLEEFPFGFLSLFLCIPCHCRNLENIIQHIYNLIIYTESFMVHNLKK